MKIVYIGAFPPGNGGVTVKNQNLYDALNEKIMVDQVNLNFVKNKSIKETIKLVKGLMNPNARLLIGISAASCKKISLFLYRFNRKALKNALLIVMGGATSDMIAADPEFKKCVLPYKKVFVETNGMKQTLDRAGFPNTSIYPNGRFRIPENRIPPVNNTGKLKCVFFSWCSYEKGVDLVVAAAHQLPEIEFDLYGYIPPFYKEEFEQMLGKDKNVTYFGQFEGSVHDIYDKLMNYDVLLFPTRWKTEGVPGVLVEAKIAGITAIVSGNSYNAEIVRDNVEGIVLKENNVECLVVAIQRLDRDRVELQNMKRKSKESAERFYIENYVDEIVGEIKQLSQDSMEGI